MIFDDERIFFLSACIAEVIRLTGHAPSTCRAFVSDFEDVFVQADMGEMDIAKAVRAAGVIVYAGQVSGREDGMRRNRSCRMASVLAHRICNRVASGDDVGEWALRRFAVETLRKAGILGEAKLAA